MMEEALDTLENNSSSKEDLVENEQEVKNALKILFKEAERGDKIAEDILTYIKTVAEKNKKPKCANTQVSK